MRQQLGVTGPVMAAGIHGFLVQRRRHDAVDFAGACERAGADDESRRSVACGGAQHPRRHMSESGPVLNQLQDLWIVACGRRRIKLADR
jgi:hypothetical protein